MKYKLIDLGPPRCPTFSTAFVSTPDGEFMVKGGHDKVTAHLCTVDFPAFFGKIKLHHAKNPPQYLIASKGVHLSQRKVGKHWWHYFENEKGFLFTRTRRMPTKWLEEIEPDLNAQLLEAAQYLRDKGLIFAARFMEDQIAKNQQATKVGFHFSKDKNA